MPPNIFKTASFALILANVASSLIGFSSLAFLDAFVFHVGSIRQGEIWRVLTAGFLHVDFMHLLFNMFTLFFFGPVLESPRLLGRSRFLILYFVALLVGNLWAFAAHFNDLNYAAVGASGAVSGVMVSVSLFVPFMMILIMGIIPVPAILFAVLFIGYSILAPYWGMGPSIGHEAHLGGAIAGLVTTLIFYPKILGHTWLQIKSGLNRRRR
ncbi:MAG: rhomboid family intramembrane serine protease [Ponticaulis sp.]|nr:rhomboid family intramembrane serine protease [Ponticaulis sp.]